MNRSDLVDRLRLTVITDPSARCGALDCVLQALAAGARSIQLRWKDGGAREMVALGKELRTATQRSDSLLIVNDRVDIALAIGADGVHLGDSDLPPDIARRITGPGFLIGASADTPEEAAAAEASGLDYVGIGPVYSTGTKSDTGSVIGLDGVRRVRAAVRLPLVGIGGIDATRARDVIEAGADAVAVVGAVMFAQEPGKAASAIVRQIEAGLKARGA